MSHDEPRLSSRQMLGIILAGGRGKRLGPLTANRCKPMMPVSKLTFLDFALATVANALVIPHTLVLTQYKQQGIINHLSRLGVTSSFWDRWITPVPAQQQFDDSSWYDGTANAVHQNCEMIADDPADLVLILAGDHITKLDPRQMSAFHTDMEAQFTVCGMVLPVDEARGKLGVMQLDEKGRIIGFEEKPLEPKEIPGRPGQCFASMGIYMGEKGFLLEVLAHDHADTTSEHDFGKNVIPLIIESGHEIYAYDFELNQVRGECEEIDGKMVWSHFWRDVGTIESYHATTINLVATKPELDIYNELWPIRSVPDHKPPYKTISPGREDVNCAPWHISAGGSVDTNPERVYMAVSGRANRISDGAVVSESILFDGAIVGRGAHVHRTIIEEGVVVPDGFQVGYDLEMDRENKVFIDSESQIRVVTRSAQFVRM